MLKLVTVIGARPQFIKAAAISRAIRTQFSDKIREVIIHTGQHYDDSMSAVFFEQLHIPRADYNLEAGSASHGVQTAKMITGLEDIFIKQKPDGVILYGDTNSTLAGAIAASKLGIPVIHIEAGMRSFTKRVPEEINRIMCDHVSTLLFSPTKTGVQNLFNEGFPQNNPGPYNVDNPLVIHCGDIMYDNSLFFREVAMKDSTLLRDLQIGSGSYSLVTVHRENNTADKDRLSKIFKGLADLARMENTFFLVPLHPRTRKLIDQDRELLELLDKNRVIILPPVSYLDMIALEANAEMIITDSGGVQKEAYYFEKPCIILQAETPWVELVESGCAKLADADTRKLNDAFRYFRSVKKTLQFPSLFGDGKASEFTVEMIVKHLGR